MFVSRAKYDEALRLANYWHGRGNAAEEQLAWLREHVDTLTAAIIPQKPVANSASAVIERKHDSVLELVGVRAGSNSARRAHLFNWVKEQRAHGAKDDELKQTLLHWPEYDPGEGDE